MPTSISEFARSLKQIGEIEIPEWDFVGLLNKELEIGDSLRKIGNLKVMDWDVKSVMPKVHEFAHQKVELPEMVRRAADYKVLDWDFRSHPKTDSAKDSGSDPEGTEMKALSDRLKGFLQFIIPNLISEPKRAEITLQNVAPGVIRCRILVTQKDIKELIGRDGSTASSIRNLLKAKASSNGVTALLEVMSHDEARAMEQPRKDNPTS